MRENPVFSIITVTHNNLPGLQKTDRSLKLQSFRDFEWIVINGGSADGTEGFLTHSNASAINREGCSKYDAMNLGLARATSDYVLFLDAGSKLAFANTLARLHNFIRSARKAPDFIYGDCLEGETYKSARAHTQLRLGMFTPHPAMIYRRGALNGLSFDVQYKIAADYDFTARMLQHVKHVDYYPLPVCAFEKPQQKSRHSRAEQFLIRRRLKIAGPLQNTALYLLQTAA
ncbi:MAG: glycosyltransferase [Alphaproteobacteria bacterium]|jgi:putative colanic acid biosynthesis glycosyltransferase|nr:glycosyltransferase [Alphaproteobacteria bacterium]